MPIDSSDAVFLAIVIWLALEIMNGGGGGRRARLPVSS
jgi:hypothetical protein